MVCKASKKVNDSKLQEISLQPNEKDKTNSSQAKDKNKVDWCKCESMEISCEMI